jgi:hypothetical protein
MEEHLLISGRDTFLIAIPFVVILMVTIFRLEQIIAFPKEVVTRRRLACGVDEHGELVLRDPDGRLSGPARPKKDSSGKGRIGDHCASAVQQPEKATARTEVPSLSIARVYFVDK